MFADTPTQALDFVAALEEVEESRTVMTSPTAGPAPTTES